MELPENPAELLQLGDLELIARQLVEGLMVGRHRSPWKGASVEFVEHRDYHPGDEYRHIDWRAWGRTGRYYVREFEDETSLQACLLVDASGSMRFAESTVSKFDYARMLAAALGSLLLNQRDAVGLATFDTQVRTLLRPTASRDTLHELTRTLQRVQPGGETSLAQVVESLLPSLQRRSLLVLISDCLDDAGRLQTALERCRFEQHEVIVFRIAAPEEEQFEFKGPIRFRSLEHSSESVQVDPARLREEYLRQYRQFCDQLQLGCGNLGIDYHSVTTQTSLQSFLGGWLHARGV